MKLTLSLLLIALLLVVSMRQSEAAVGGCVGCTIVVTVLEQIAIAHPGYKLKDAAQLWCQALSGEQDWLFKPCNEALGAIAPLIELDWKLGATPDESCRKLTLCKGDDTLCALWPKNKSLFEEQQTPPVSPQALEAFQGFFDESEALFEYIFGAALNWSTLGEIKQLHDFPALSKYKPQEETAADDYWYLRPFFDEDKDLFSTVDQLRGSAWRGKDCDETNPEVYPTRSTRTSKTSDPNIDHNCNGISTLDPGTRKGYEELLCGGTKTYQYVGIGDSATAHFSLPPAWLSGREMTKTTYRGLIQIAMNEVDWPQCSLSTGHNSTQCPSFSKTLAGDYTSIYAYGRERNLCSHRQFQNVGINGASYKNYAPKLKASFRPNPETDAPAVVILNLIGNDVCGKHTDPKDMTSPEEYKSGLLDIVTYLDSVLAPGSHVHISGLVDGTMLYDVMWNQTHPSGTTYKAFYDYLNCLKTSPCSGWLNSNEAIRNSTTAHARKLSQIARDLISNQSSLAFKHITLYYTDIEAQLAAIVNRFKADRYDASRLIEGTDGFHPSSITNVLLSRSFIASMIDQGLHDVMFPLNPLNNKIVARYGADMNGY
jgi:acyloxyacyl hydrolase